MMYSAYKLNKQGDNIQPWWTPFPIWNQCCSMSSSNCCFLTCIQISQEASQVVWYSHLFKNFLQFVVIHTVKAIGVVNKAEVNVFSSWLIGKDSDAGRDWGQEKKGMTEDEMAGWHHWLNGRESEWTPGVGDGQGGLACCNSWGRKESDTTERLNWTELKCFFWNSLAFSVIQLMLAIWSLPFLNLF